MKRQDTTRIAEAAAGLKTLVVLSMPDCLLIDHWSAVDADVESIAHLMGTAVHACRQLTQATSGKANPETLNIETPDALILVCPMGIDLATGFVFDRTTTTIGLARIQIRDMLLELEPLLRTDIGRKPPPAVPLPIAEPAGELPHGELSAAELSAALSSATEGSTAEDAAPPSPPAPPLPSDEQGPAARPRAVRLLEYLQRYAPDPHVSLLRLSLRTGIALERLDRPELLTNEQVESMAASVRDIIGKEQLGI